MSIRAISWVWQNSKQKGGALLLELAIADFADDEGRAWPAIATLAVKARMTPRNVNLVIEKKLKPAGLLIKQNAGPHQTNLFQLPVHGGEKISPLKDFQDEARFLEPLKPASANPSLNRHNKTKSSTGVLNGANAPSHVVNSSPKKKSKPARHPPTDPEPEAFTSWYVAYPRHEGREDALKAWRKLNPNPELIQTLMTATATYAAAKADTERQYIKTPAAWLHGKRWEDELEKREPVKKRTFVNG